MYAGAVVGILLAEVLYLRAVRILGGAATTCRSGSRLAWHGGVALVAIGLLSPIDGARARSCSRPTWRSTC